ncbi:hypothetical protein K8I61_06890 [bacterium]|nr:hypothetical protein [bacterium]
MTIAWAQASGSGALDLSSEKYPWRRLAPDPDAWAQAIVTRGVDHLFVEPVRGPERGYIRWDENGFPLERTWARERPDIFRLVAGAPDFELYRVIAAPESES